MEVRMVLGRMEGREEAIKLTGWTESPSEVYSTRQHIIMSKFIIIFLFTVSGMGSTDVPSFNK